MLISSMISSIQRYRILFSNLLYFIVIVNLANDYFVDSTIQGNKPRPRNSFGFTASNAGLLYIFGGSEDEEWTIVLGDLFSFDPAINSWMEMPPAFDGNFTIARNSMGIDSIGELLYIFGGYNMVDSYGYGVYGNNGFLNDLYSFNTETLVWTQLVPRDGNNAPSHRMAMGFTAASDRYLFVFGGYDGVPGGLQDLHRYDPTNNFWLDLSDNYIYSSTPSARYHMGFTSIDQNLYMFGGQSRDDIFGEMKYFSDLFAFNTVSHTWSQLTISGESPSPRCAMGFSRSFTKNLYLFGGLYEEETMGDFYALELNSMKWINLTQKGGPSARSSLGLASTQNGWLYLYGGLENNHLYQYRPSYNLWSSCDATDETCLLCPTGFYSATGRSNSTCLACRAGFYSESEGLENLMLNFVSAAGASSINACLSCKQGTFSSAPGASSIHDCSNCSSGSFSSHPGTSTCSLCESGQYTGDLASILCSICNVGTYQSGIGESFCLACTAGTYQTGFGMMSINSCNLCPVGMFQTGSGMINCSSCRKGTYGSGFGASRCLLCAAGSYQTGVGGTGPNCSKCIQGKYLTGNGMMYVENCLQCPSGTYQNERGSSNCMLCAAGTYQTGFEMISVGMCELCPSGKFQTGMGMTNCTNFCTPGSFSASGATACVLCRPGKFTSTQGSFECEECKGGAYTTMFGSDFASCVPCDGGTYSMGKGATSCIYCKAGKYSTSSGANNSSVCVDCASGKYSAEDGALGCVACDPGSYSSPGQSNCFLCQPGEYASGYGSKLCTVCVTGSYSVERGALSCNLCPAGTFSTIAHADTAEVCTSCGAGTFSSSNGASALAACAPCSAGSFSSAKAANSSLSCSGLCSAGQFSTVLGATSSEACVKCFSGTFSLISGASVCNFCKAGTFSTLEGLSQSVCQYCPAGTSSWSLGASSARDCSLCSPGKFSEHSGATSCAGCEVGTYSTILGSDSSRLCLPCEMGTYTDRVGNPSNKLVAYFAFSSNGFLLDSSPNDLVLIPSHDPPQISTDCLFGTCAKFEYDYDDISEWQSFSLEDIYFPDFGSTGISLCVWYNANQRVHSGQTLFDFNHGQLSASRQYESDDLIVRLYMENSLLWYTIVNSGMAANQWNHLCITVSPENTWSVYLNATIQGLVFTALDAPFSSHWTSNVIGRPHLAVQGNESLSYTCRGHMFLGRLQEFRIYTKVLTPAEITSLVEWRYDSSNATSCVRCEIGKYSTALSATSSHICNLCAPGTFSPHENASKCSTCPAGTYSSSLGSVESDVCKLCGAGTFSAFINASSCLKCVSGTFSEVSGSTDSSSCRPCGAGKFSAAGSSSCQSCFTTEPCHDLKCPQNQFRNGFVCSDCTKCSAANLTLTQCTSLSDVQCNPCNGESCNNIEATISFSGFESIAEFYGLGAAALKLSVAQSVGLDLSSTNIIISSACFGSTCENLIRSLRVTIGVNINTVLVTFRIISQADPLIINTMIRAQSFSSQVSRQVSAMTGRVLIASNATVSNIACKPGFYQSGPDKCMTCTVCNGYAQACGQNFDAVCQLSSNMQDTVTAVVASVSVFFSLVIFIVGLTYFRKRKVACASRRLVGAEPGNGANQQDLPYELRRKYEAVCVLGSGSFGVVLDAWQINNGKRIIRRAIKLVHAKGRLFTDKELRRLNRESSIMSRVKNQNIVQFVESGLAKTLDVYWIVMEMLQGSTLSNILTKNGPFSEVDVIKIGLDVCAGLKALHSIGVIHRDVKPANIIYSRSGTSSTSTCDSKDSEVHEVDGKDTTDIKSTKGDGDSLKLIDFGTAIGVKDSKNDVGSDASESLMTFSKLEFAGTPAFSSPESFNSPGTVSFTADIWSFSVSLFQLASGMLPFEASTPLLASISIAAELDVKAPDVRDCAPEHVRSGMSSAFALVIAKGLEKRLGNRFQSVDELATALHGCLVQRGEEIYSAFISYRVFSEKFHAMLLYDVLNNTRTPGGHRVIVYLDVKRLVKGEDWEEGFSLGLLNSLVALPLVSEGVLRPFSQLKGRIDDKSDNVLKEFIIMQALQGYAGKLEATYPIFIGRPNEDGDNKYPCSGDFFTVNAEHVAHLIDAVSLPTCTSVLKFLEKNKIQVHDKVKSITVKSAVHDLLSLQGGRLWDHPKLAEEDIPEDSEIVLKLLSDPPTPPLDIRQLRMLKAELRQLVPAIHEVVDRAYSKHTFNHSKRSSISVVHEEHSGQIKKPLRIGPECHAELVDITVDLDPSNTYFTHWQANQAEFLGWAIPPSYEPMISGNESL